jgi:hypothetical protein
MEQSLRRHDQLGDSVSHYGKAHGRDHGAGTEHWHRQSGKTNREQEDKNMPSPVPRMTCFQWIRHINTGTTFFAGVVIQSE